ncbi:unnamed protein product, partial [Staurois parvus]
SSTGLPLQAYVCLLQTLSDRSTLTPICWGGALLTPICRGGAQNPGPDSMKRPAHTCAISLLAIPKTWPKIGDFIPPRSL